MSTYRSDDPYEDFRRRESEQERWLNNLPVCDECNRPIQDEHYFEFEERIICEECLEFNHKKRTEDFYY